MLTTTSIIFIHGLQGHPRKTWASKVRAKTQKRSIMRSALSALSGKSSDQSQRDDSHSAKSGCFWPEDLLAKDLARLRIVTYGYESKVSNFFSGAADQTTIIGHGRSLLHDLEAFRRPFPNRPIIFLAHSLGGIILKETLRRSFQAKAYEEDLRAIYDNTRAIIFMGTPHRGSQYAPWGILARNIVKAVGFDTNDRLIRDLKVDSAILDLLAEDFSKILNENQITAFTFLEAQGPKGFRGLNHKIVEDVSASLNHARERKDVINANHMEMCRFSDANDNGYRKVKAVVEKCLDSIVASDTLSELANPCTLTELI